MLHCPLQCDADDKNDSEVPSLLPATEMLMGEHEDYSGDLFLTQTQDAQNGDSLDKPSLIRQTWKITGKFQHLWRKGLFGALGMEVIHSQGKT